MSADPSLIASDPAVSAWVAANAGAGKTFTLANRVARLLLADTRPERILCLTFTKAAAAEMQDRLFRQLGEWAMLDDAALTAKIAAIGGTSDNLPKARRLFAQALETPGGLKVLTIHAFCQLVLSRFPLEAGIAPAFEVLDEQTARALAAEARTDMLERAGGGDAALAAAVTHLVNGSGEAGLNALLDAALTTDRRRLDRFFAALDTGSLAEAARRAHDAPEETADDVAGNFCAALKDEIARLRESAAWLGGGGKTDGARAQDITAFLATDFGLDGFVHLETLFLTGEGERRKSLATKKLALERADLANFLEDLQHRFCDMHERWRAARAAALAGAALTLLAAVRQSYAAAKRARGVLDYDDLIAATRDLLLDGGSAAWVLYKLDGGIDHVLIDEAQDTSPEQWEIVKALTEHFFARASSARIARTIFAVGDEKQSIFSFQGADPAQFAVNRDHFAALAEDAGLAFVDQPLQTSRRSAPEILAFVDKVFESETAREGLTSDNSKLEHRAFRVQAPGGIEVWPLLSPEDAEETDPYVPFDARRRSPESPVVRLAAKIAGRIREWLDQGATLPGHDAPIRPADIMILLPRRNPFGGEVIRQLKLRGVPVAGADRLVLTEQIAVMDLMALGHFVLQRQDDLNLAALLRSPLCGLSEEALFDLAHHRDGSLWNALAASASEFTEAHAFLAEMLALADQAPPFEFYSHALIARGGREKLLARLGNEAADTVDEFLSLTLSHEQGQTPSLQGFLDWLARGATEIKRDMERGRNEVRVMTVHGAKGLEADIVILPDTTALREPEGGQLLYDGDDVLFPVPAARAPARVRLAREALKAEWRREHRRLLYVALTRARDRLIVCGFENRHGAKDGSWYRLAEEAAQLLAMPPHEDGLGFGTLAMRHAGARKQDAGKTAPPDWLRHPAPPERAPPRAIRPSEAVTEAVEEPPVFSPLGRGAARFRRGLVVHALLARLPEIAPDRRLRLAREFARARGFAAADAEALANETLAVLDDPQFAAAFGPDSQAEAGLVAQLPELGRPINGRIDRLAVTPDEVLILDFKTNRPPPADEGGIAPLYLGQMALYRAGAARLFPGRRIVCGLLFTDGPRLLRLSDAILDRQWADMVRRLDPGAAGSYI